MALRRVLCSQLSAGRFPVRFDSVWSRVEMGPEDPILGLTLAYQKDEFPQKVNLGVGAYRDDSGKPYVLSCVRKAEALVNGKVDHEYLPIVGLSSFNKCAQKLLFGENSPSLAAGRIGTAQTISGTGALRVAGEFLARFYPGDKTVHMPTPTWGNHEPVFVDSGLTVGSYPYYDAATCGLLMNDLCAKLEQLPNNSIVLLHACAHNPTGVDPSTEQWQQILEILKKKNHFPFVDCAYQGFASGDTARDAAFVRMLDAAGLNFLVTQSFAKNFGLYGQRVGALHMVCNDEKELERVMSQLKILIRPMYSNPPLHGARLVSAILTADDLSEEWASEVAGMAKHMLAMREQLVHNLAAAGSTRDWSHVLKQIGMFAFSGLTKEQCIKLRDEHHIYMTLNGRIAVPGLNSYNVGYVAEAIHKVTV